MDPITTAIVSALANLSKEAIKDSYNALKASLQKRFGSDSGLAVAIEQLESKPGSEGRKATLQEEIELVQAGDDSDIIKLAENLLNELKEKADGKSVVTQIISNVKYAATSGIGDANVSNITENNNPVDNK